MVDMSCQQLRNSSIRSEQQFSAREFTCWLCVGALMLSLVLAYSFNQSKILSIQYQIEEINADNDRLRDESATLRAQYQSLKNPERILQQAQDIGLISANRPEVTIIQADPFTRVDQSLVAAVHNKPSLDE